MMNTRQTLHELVDHLPEEDLITAVRVLKGLELAPDSLTLLLENAPVDDEPFDPADLEFDESEPLIPHEEVMRRFRE
jgi:hypothetical protein